MQRSSFRLALEEDVKRYHLILGRPLPASSFGLWFCLLSPRLFPNLLIRLANLCHRKRITVIARMLSLIAFGLFGIEVALQCEIGPGLFLPHTQGTVIGAIRIGRNATIFQGVTIGAREVDFSFAAAARPQLGDDVTIGAGAKVLGGVEIGSGCMIGANAVVVSSMTSGSSARAPIANIIVRGASGAA